MKLLISFAVFAVVIFSCSAEEAPTNAPNIASLKYIKDMVLRDIFDMLPLLLQKIIYGLHGLFLDLVEILKNGGDDFSMLSEVGNFFSGMILP